MFGGLRLGRLFGIPIQINYSFLVLAGIFAVWQGLPGLVLLAVMFGSVLLHELGHALVARRLGVPILGIDLHFFGGAAKMGRMPASAKEEILIAAAGPIVSFVLALVGLIPMLATGWFGFMYLAGINLVLGVFNLLPALPMDGGRIFRALLSRKMGRLKATSIAVKVARVIAVGLGLLGLARGNFFLVGLAVMLWFMASAELRAAQLWHHASQGMGGTWPGFGSAGFGGPGGPIFDGAPGARDDGDVEVLDQEGRVVDGQAGMPQMGRMGQMGQMAAGFRIEEQITGGRRRWIIRDQQGQVIFMAEQPLRW